MKQQASSIRFDGQGPTSLCSSFQLRWARNTIKVYESGRYATEEDPRKREIQYERYKRAMAMVLASKLAE